MQQLLDLQLPLPQRLYVCLRPGSCRSDKVSVGEEVAGRGEKEGFGFPDSG